MELEITNSVVSINLLPLGEMLLESHQDVHNTTAGMHKGWPLQLLGGTPWARPPPPRKATAAFSIPLALLGGVPRVSAEGNHPVTVRQLDPAPRFT